MALWTRTNNRILSPFSITCICSIERALWLENAELDADHSHKEEYTQNQFLPGTANATIFCGFHEPIFGTIITISEICRNYNWSAHFVWNVISFASLVELYFRHSIQSFNHTFFWIGWSLCVCRTYGLRFRIEYVYLNKVGFCVQFRKKTKEKQNNCILNGNWNWAFVLSFGFYSAQITPSNNKHWMVMNWNGSDWFGLVRIGWDWMGLYWDLNTSGAKRECAFVHQLHLFWLSIPFEWKSLESKR